MTEEKIYLVYKHTSPSGKSYVGQTCNYQQRVVRHNHKGCSAFLQAIKKYGWDAFTHEILARDLTINQANKLEQKLITEHNTLVPNGYNLLPGGKNHKHNLVTKLRLSEVNTGKVLSDETKHKMSMSKKGRKLTDETRKKISIAHVGMHSPLKGLKKGPMSDEIKQKISKANKGRPAHNKGKSPSNITRYKISQAHKGKPAHNKGVTQPKVVCPQCGREGGVVQMPKWHFNNCRELGL